MLRLQAESVALLVSVSLFSDEGSVQEIARIQLYCRFCRINLKNSTAIRFASSRPQRTTMRQTTGRLIRPALFRNSAIQFRAAMKLPSGSRLTPKIPTRRVLARGFSGSNCQRGLARRAQFKMTLKTGRSAR